LLAACVAAAAAAAVPASAAGGIDYPNVNACLPQQLRVDVVTGLGIGRDPHWKRGQKRYFAVADTFATNVSPVPCMLTGVPAPVLVQRGHVLPLHYMRGGLNKVTSDNVGDAAVFAADSLLLPGGYAQLAVDWSGPWCGNRTKVVVRVPLAVGEINSAAVVKPPPCKGRGLMAVSSDYWTPEMQTGS